MPPLASPRTGRGPLERVLVRGVRESALTPCFAEIAFFILTLVGILEFSRRDSLTPRFLYPFLWMTLFRNTSIFQPAVTISSSPQSGLRIRYARRLNSEFDARERILWLARPRMRTVFNIVLGILFTVVKAFFHALASTLGVLAFGAAALFAGVYAWRRATRPKPARAIPIDR